MPKLEVRQILEMYLTHVEGVNLISSFSFAVVINLTDLKKIMQTKVLCQIDHKNLDLDVEYFGNGRHSYLVIFIYYIYYRCSSIIFQAQTSL
tara:strand:- start:1412 stop:1687 length:276 start_codon:yes stop_codon:yes gene_type:complete